jgi:hypothetical protein
LLLPRLARTEIGRMPPVNRDAVQDLNHVLSDLDSRLQRFAEMLRSQEEVVASDSVDAEQLGEVRRAFNNLLRSFQQNE